VSLLCVPGVCAAVVDIGATWMSDLKEGVCHCCVCQVSVLRSLILVQRGCLT